MKKDVNKIEKENIYLAPMEGITGYVFRNAYNNIYGNIDKYFTPFIVPTIKREFKTRELRDILPENNEGMKTVPQILTNKAEGFIRTVENLKKYGYREVNINMGCPSGTVVAKNRGAGFLAFPDKIDNFLKEIFDATDVEISVKTRIGMENPEEFYGLLEVFNKYPLKELIIHPRLRIDYYKNSVNMDMFKYAYENSKNPICYNGDIKTKEDYEKLISVFSNVCGVMLGRGIISNPMLINEIKTDDKDGAGNEIIYKSKDENSNEKLLKLKDFHEQLYFGYRKEIEGDINILYKMKEMWFYFADNFKTQDKLLKKIKKSNNLSEYEAAVKLIFDLE